MISYFLIINIRLKAVVAAQDVLEEKTTGEAFFMFYSLNKQSSCHKKMLSASERMSLKCSRKTLNNIL